MLAVVVEVKRVLDWTDLAQGIAAIAEMVALVIGGAWAYFLFIRGRTFSRRLEPLAKGEYLEVNGARMVRVRLQVRNAGAAVVRFADYLQSIYLYGATSADLPSGSNVLWSVEHLVLTPVLQNHKWIEGGETISDEVLVPVPDAPDGEKWVAYRLDIKLVSRRRPFRDRYLQWSTTIVVPAEVGLRMRPD